MMKIRKKLQLFVPKNEEKLKRQKGAEMESFLWKDESAEEGESGLAVSWCTERRVMTAVGTRGE